MKEDKSAWVAGAVSQFERRLLRYTSRLVPESIAREIVQETFLCLLQEDIEKVDGHLAQWLFSVCRHQAFDLRRREDHRARVAGEITSPAVVSPEDHAVQAQGRHSAVNLVNGLSHEQQEVIRLKFQEELSYKEISAITGHSMSYVGVLIHEAMKDMRERAKK